MARWLRSSDEIGDESPTRQRSGRSRMAWLLVGVLVVSSGLLLWSPGAEAKSQFLSGFATTYPAAANSPLNGCLLCHTDANPSGNNKARNSYGDDWGEEGDKKYSPIENLDSDGDGWTNIQEIRALSFPGNRNSTPNTVTTTTTTPGTPPNGQALYAARCAACHGANGGNLNGTSLPRSSFINITVNGQGGMPAQTGISSAEVGAIWDYVTGSAPGTTTTTAPGATTTTTAPAGGATVWAQSCAGCHGANGGDVVPTSLSRTQLVSVVNNGTGGMPPFGSLGSAQVGNVVDYLLSLSTPTTTLPGATTTTTTPRSGAVVFASSCAKCHGSGGGDLRGNALSLSQAIDIVANGQGSMSGFAGRLSPAEISNVGQFVRSVGTSSGVTTTTAAPGTASGTTIYGQQCALCHGAGGGNLRGHNLPLTNIVSIVADGQGTMGGFSSRLSAADINTVSQFVLSVGAGSGVTTTTAASGSTVSGSNLYMQNCSSCHGLHGEGGPGGALSGTSLNRTQTIAVITSGTTGMPGYASQLSSAEIAAIADHVLGVAGKVAIPPELAEGLSLFGQFCAACHGVDGEGGLGGPVAGIGMGAVELDEIIRNGVGSMPGFAERMSDGEVAALVAFTEALAAGEEFGPVDETTTTAAGPAGESGPQALESQPIEKGGSSPVPVIVVSLLAGLIAAGAAVLWARTGRDLIK